MGKQLATWFFLILFFAAVFIFYSKDDKDLRESVKSVPVSIPRVTLKNFKIEKYIGVKKISNASGKLAYFIEPDILEVYGKITAADYTKDHLRIAKGDTLTAYFNTSGLIDLAKESSISRAILENHVELIDKDNRIYTNIVSYNKKKDILSSDREVSIDSSQGKLYGENGFIYKISDEFLKLMGPVNGLLRSESVKGLKK